MLKEWNWKLCFQLVITIQIRSFVSRIETMFTESKLPLQLVKIIQIWGSYPTCHYNLNLKLFFPKSKFHFRNRSFFSRNRRLLLNTLDILWRTIRMYTFKPRWATRTMGMVFIKCKRSDMKRRVIGVHLVMKHFDFYPRWCLGNVPGQTGNKYMNISFIILRFFMDLVQLFLPIWRIFN